MDFTPYLKEPIFISEESDLSQTCERIRIEDHTCAFLRRSDEIYAIKSFILLLSIPSDGSEWSADTVEVGTPLKIIPYEELPARALDVLACEVILVDYYGKLTYMLREDFLLIMVSSEHNQDAAWLRKLFSSIPRGLMIVDLNYAVVNSNTEALRMLKIPESHISHVRMDYILGTTCFEYARDTYNAVLNQVITCRDIQAAILVDFVPLVTSQAISGFALVIQDLPSVEAMAMELGSIRQLNEDLEAILSTIYDEIVVVDATGTLLRASGNFIPAHWANPPQMLIGQPILNPNICGEIVCHVIEEVQMSRRKVSLMHKEGEYPMICSGNPIFTKAGDLERIVIASRDLTEVSRLKNELEKTRKQSENYRRELESLRQRVKQITGTVPIYVSTAMHEVMREAERVAQFSATVLLTGESGVGKEVVANAIHSLSPRTNLPFVKINCAAIPEALLESELFGYEKGAFSGANASGKIGLFLKAHKGTLFLDEISELDWGIQSKLLRAIQEREVYPVGSTTPVKFDVRIIAAANRSLYELVETGKFRADLYYRVNVFPLDIPPLRRRKEDIAVLANHFLFQFNQNYDRNLRFSSSAIELLETFPFPGNVRELQNVIQRAAIKCDGNVIDAEVVDRTLKGSQQDDLARKSEANQKHFQEVVPLRTAFEQVEQELISLAMNKFHSTTKAAQALGISQSSVSRKFQKIQHK